MSRRLRLALAAAVFIGWIGYLGYTALSKHRGPIVSRAQAAAMQFAVVATVEAGEDGKPGKQVTIERRLTENGPKEGDQIDVENLPRAEQKSGFTGPGQYLLLLTGEPYLIVGQQRSPGNDLEGVGAPLVYRWSGEVEKQIQGLLNAARK